MRKLMPVINGQDVTIFSSAEELARTAALRFINEGQAAIQSQGRFVVCLGGGETPRRVYEIISTNCSGLLDWTNVHVFFGDERCVPPEHPDSNYLMAYTALISKVPIPSRNVHRMAGEKGAAAGALDYERELKGFFANQNLPRFDFVYLGLGQDGHTASLFPRSSVLNETSRWIGTSKPVGNFPDRITLTFPVFNNAAHIMFLVTGREKANILEWVLKGSDRGPLPPFPAKLIRPTNGSVEWFVDRFAAAQLPPALAR
jgi:6-phosphogluconolactonase